MGIIMQLIQYLYEYFFVNTYENLIFYTYVMVQTICKNNFADVVNTHFFLYILPEKNYW